MPGADKPRRRNLAGHRQYRIIPSRFPPVDLFEELVDHADLEIAYAIESLTNDRLQAEAGNLHLVPKAEWVTGPGATVVMAAFTHIGNPSRFSDGSYGLDEETAIAETVFHSERRLRATSEAPIELDMRVYVGRIQMPLDDLRAGRWRHLRDPDLATWPITQAFGRARRDDGSLGLLYRSARMSSGTCVAAFRTRAISRPRQGKHLRYCWDGSRIVHVFSVSQLRLP